MEQALNEISYLLHLFYLYKAYVIAPILFIFIFVYSVDSPILEWKRLSPRGGYPAQVWGRHSAFLMRGRGPCEAPCLQSRGAWPPAGTLQAWALPSGQAGPWGDRRPSWARTAALEDSASPQLQGMGLPALVHKGGTPKGGS